MLLMRRPAARRRHERGFNIVELMVTLTLLAILLALAVPSFTSWIRNTRVRTVSESLQNGLRLAQTEAVRRNRQVLFYLTNAEPSATATSAANGRNWVIRTVPLLTGEATEFIRGGALSDVASGVTITGPTVMCFNSIGRRIQNDAPGVGGTAKCSVDPANPLDAYNIALTGADRPLRITVSVSGQIRMCDPAKNLAAASDGCPT